jgi:hypothetical protein
MENPFDRLAEEQKRLRHEAFQYYLLIESGCLTQFEQGKIWRWLWKHNGDVDRTGKIRMMLLNNMRKDDIDVVANETALKYAPERLRVEMMARIGKGDTLQI